MVLYDDNHTRDMYKLYNTETKRVITSSNIKWEAWKTTYPAETMKMFRDWNEDDIVKVIEEDKTTTPEPEDQLRMHIIPDEGESARMNEKPGHKSLRNPRNILI